MTASSPLPAPQLLPLARYRDLGTALDWLHRAFGFEKQVAVSDADGQVIYAQVTYGTSMMMLGAVRDTDLDALMRQPDEVGGIETQSCYVVVGDADAHHKRAVEAGAEIVLELKSDGLGRRGYSCRDPEGHIWSFGTYNPAHGFAPAEVELVLGEQQRVRRWPRRAAGIVALIFAGAVGWGLHGATKQEGGLANLARMDEAERAYTELSKVRAEKRGLETALAQARGALEAERKSRASAEAAAEEARKEAAAERDAKASLEKARDELNDALERERAAKQAAELNARKAEEQLATEREARVALEHETAAAQQSAVDQQLSAQAAQESAAGQLETSSTTTEVPPADAPQAKDTIIKKAAAAARVKKPVSRRGPVPTYLIELSHVPWPYTDWYGQ